MSEQCLLLQLSFTDACEDQEIAGTGLAILLQRYPQQVPLVASQLAGHLLTPRIRSFLWGFRLDDAEDQARVQKVLARNSQVLDEFWGATGVTCGPARLSSRSTALVTWCESHQLAGISDVKHSSLASLIQRVTGEKYRETFALSGWDSLKERTRTQEVVMLSMSSESADYHVGDILICLSVTQVLNMLYVYNGQYDPTNVLCLFPLIMAHAEASVDLMVKLRVAIAFAVLLFYDHVKSLSSGCWLDNFIVSFLSTMIIITDHGALLC